MKITFTCTSIIMKSIGMLNLCVVLLVWGVNLSAQSMQSPVTWKANRFGQEHGLLQLNVKDMAIDSLGFLWVGTEDGLHRFNGYEFKAFVHNPEDSTSLKDDHIRGLHFADNTLWLASSVKGIGAYIPKEDRFFYPGTEKKINKLNTTYRVLQHSRNLLLFAAENHFIYHNTITGSNRIFALPVNGKTSYITDVLHLPGDKCWLSTTASGIVEMDTAKMEIRQTHLLPDKVINCLYQTTDKIFIGTETGLYIYDKGSRSITLSALLRPVNCFYEKAEGELLIGSDNGMLLFDITSNSLTPIILYVNDKRIYESVDINRIIGDKRENIWIGTEGDGLLYYNDFQKKFNTLNVRLKEYPLTADISTFQLLKETSGSLLLGTKLGIIRYNNKDNSFKHFPGTKDMLIYTLKRDKNGDIWAGGFTSGLLKYNPKRDKFETVQTQGSDFSDKDIVEIIVIDSNTLWICTWSGGIYQFDTNTNHLTPKLIDGQQINRARTSFTDSNGNIWLGTDGGVYQISPDQIIRYHSGSAPQISSDRVFSFSEDKAGNIWVGTNVGLTKLNPEKNYSRLYYKQKGLPNDFIYGIQIDEKDKIWVSTNYGLSVLDQQDETFRNYTANDGLQNNEFNGKAAYQDASGIFYFAGISGINIFDPEKIIENPYLPEVYIESLELFNSALESNEMYKEHLRFKNSDNVLSFNYVALNFLNPEKCNYQYKMNGFDEDWRPVTKNRSTTYTNLDPGDYTFMVRASNDAGIWNQVHDKLRITIIPPWYETNAFRLLFLLIFLATGPLFYFYQTRKLKKDKIKLEQMVSQRTIQVREKNVRLEKAFQEAEKQRDNISFLMKELRHRVKNNLQIISSMLNLQSNTVETESAKEALKMAKNRIIAISQIENRMSHENENIDIGAFIGEISKGIVDVLSSDQTLNYNLKQNPCSVEIKKINTTLIGLILNELITNATKYAFDEYKAENTLTIDCVIGENKLILTISDNGKGYDPSSIKPNSLGLELVHEMVTQIGGTLYTESENGTKNTLIIPLNC